ncbi:pentapeptide repeat-containing protein [Nostoc sp. MG11]|uniref:pentapeptide repeat-containing protein n=1 Tax=Nostoc sp. MG11 TaxID=2721166 RepID=UPI001868620C|nr:pentapeptide repeat-containing protein [Nostoc sp. MG11]
MSKNILKFLSIKPTFRLLLLIVFVSIPILYRFNWSGFGEDSSKSKSIEKTITNGKIISFKKIETEHFESAKKLWDWLNLAAILAIPFVLFQFERSEQRRSEKEVENEKNIAHDNFREEILQAYVDSMSELLIDKQLKLLLNLNLKQSDTQYSQIEVALDIARARTLSILRRLREDKKRTIILFEFLSDIELLDKPLLSTANLEKANLEGTNLEGANLENANLRGANLEDANLTSANLENADLRDANFRGTNLFVVNLKDANLRGALLENTNLKGAELNGTFLEGANLTSADLEGTKLRDAHFTNANFTKAFLKDAYLTSANFTNANLTSAFLEGASLEDANLTSANLENANLKGAYLTSANFTNANLKGANLENAVIEYGVYADEQRYIEDANFENANLEDANLTGVELKGAKLKGAILNERTILPDGSKYQFKDQLAKFTSLG